MKLKFKIPLLFTALIVGSLLAVSALIHWQSSKTVESLMKESVERSSNQSQQNLNSLINAEVSTANMLAMDENIKNIAMLRQNDTSESFFESNKASVEKMSTYLKQKFDLTRSHEHFFIVDKNGVIFADSHPNFLKINVGTRDYIQKALKGEINISDVVLSKATNKYLVIFAAPVYNDARDVIAVAVNSVYVEYFTAELSQNRIGDTGYSFLTDSKGLYLSHPKQELVGQPIEETNFKSIAENMNVDSEKTLASTNYEFEGNKGIQSIAVVPKTGWYLSTAVLNSDISKPTKALLNKTLVMSLGAALVMLMISILISRTLIKPITSLVKTMETASSGDLTVQSNIMSNDEIGSLAQGFNLMVNRLRSLIEEINRIIVAVNGTSSEILSSSETTAVSIEEVARTVEQISEGTQVQSVNLQSVIDHFSVVRDEFGKVYNYSNDMKAKSEDTMVINENSNKIVSMLYENTKTSTMEIEKIIEIIKDLQANSKNIVTITDSIKSIAEQTSLLSLNASIEAARAGEHGRGFAVVAEEIRKLSDESTSSAKEIEKILNDILSKTENAVTITDSVKETVNEQNYSVNHTVEAFEKISENVKDIKNQIENINLSLSHVGNETSSLNNEFESISAISEETAASTEEVSASTEEQSAVMLELTNSIKDLNTTVETLALTIQIFKL
ncbi:methyl-accepting chemotaxis sensory transducer with Cache sensor [Clostridium amylolyticum]|uniref:Methyl-accepting chemotaxis sensory transducer with Cache sensor n=1 Tax=Clostridium amylolyticum TaxID=1121298 RepID=A0A1M6MA72_9CLOT|nr:methyl-accepting chemotaxis protein [Clostridium amylolyticum]SHJ80270.1 methyl-accepting chemotaxis sensory transducer with Cache sensor [Clostridium amylolyticum]